jgi:hypothetical protein
MPKAWSVRDSHRKLRSFDTSFGATVVDLSKIKHLPLHDLAASAATILHNAPITMLFAVFNPGVALQA